MARGLTRKKKILSHGDLDVYREAFEAAMTIFDHSRGFPREESYSLTDQIRRSSRSVAANIAEGWRKRRYKAAFISKFSDAETEAAETQVWIEFSVKCGYLDRAAGRKLYRAYDILIRKLVGMIHYADRWTIKAPPSAADSSNGRA